MEWRFASADEIYPSTMHEEIMLALHEHGMANSDFNSAEVIYGELISNAIRHAAGSVRVRLDWQNDFPTLSVHDEQRATVTRRAIALPEDPLAESGRGLFIVKTLARDFHQEHEPNDGTAAFATLPVRKRSA